MALEVAVGCSNVCSKCPFPPGWLWRPVVVRWENFHGVKRLILLTLKGELGTLQRGKMNGVLYTVLRGKWWQSTLLVNENSLLALCSLSVASQNLCLLRWKPTFENHPRKRVSIGSEVSLVVVKSLIMSLNINHKRQFLWRPRNIYIALKNWVLDTNNCCFALLATPLVKNEKWQREIFVWRGAEGPDRLQTPDSQVTGRAR